jgi:hypothetical protein
MGEDTLQWSNNHLHKATRSVDTEKCRMQCTACPNFFFFTEHVLIFIKHIVQHLTQRAKRTWDMQKAYGKRKQDIMSEIRIVLDMQ